MANDKNKHKQPQQQPHHQAPPQRRTDPPPASASAPQERPGEAEATASPPQERTYKNHAAAWEVPGATPRGGVAPRGEPSARQGAPRVHRRLPRRSPNHGQQERTPGAVPVQQRVHADRPVRDLAENETMSPRQLVAYADDLIRDHKADPASVNPTSVQLLNLQALLTYGKRVEQLGQELARARKAIVDLSHTVAAQVDNDNDDDEPAGRPARGASARAARLLQKQGRRDSRRSGRPRRASGLPGRRRVG